jgi:glycerol-3-phosphate dehydrogenase
VIGGGIQGAGVAQAAAAAGYSVLLAERRSWGAGTSSKSSKLIHGGLRYLRNGQLRLVRESLRERRILERIAPQLVRPDDFHIPVYGATRVRPWQLRLALSLYWMLSGCRAEARFRRLSRGRWHELTGLRRIGLQQIFAYRDARTDDRRLTAAVAASAADLGAELACPASMTGAHWLGDCWQITLDEAGRSRRISSRLLVNCAGPWANEVAATIDPRPPQPQVALVQGAHLVLSRPAVDRCYYLEVPEDGRAVFLLPWGEGSLLGTTETPFSGSPDDARITPEEEAYLLRVLGHYFPGEAPEIAARMAGLRVLPASPAAPLRRSREVMLTHTPHRRPNYIAVYGGKLTGYRATALKVLRLARNSLPRRRARTDTARLPLPGID